MVKLYESLISLFSKHKDYINYTIFDVPLEEYVKLTLKISFIAFLLSLISLNILFIFLFRFLDMFLIVLSLIFAILISSGVFLYLYYYPKLAMEDYKKDIDDNLPFFSQYVYALSGSGMNIIDIFRIVTKRKEFGSLGKEIKYLVTLIDTFGYDLTSACLKVAQRTPSNKFKEFLYGVISVIRAGGDIKEFFREYSRNRLEEYRIELKTYIEKSNTFVTIYGFLFITSPLILLILAFLFSVTSNSSIVLDSLNIFFVGIIPLLYVIYYYLIYISQPRL